MTRALVDGLESAHPIARLLPGVYQDDEFVIRLVGALDDVLAPIFLTLDNLDAHFDPMLAPDDFLPWLAEWVGLLLDDTWSPAFAREAVARTVELYAWRGTRRGIHEIVELYTGVVPEIVESGATVWSTEPDPEPPGSPRAGVVVRLAVVGASTADLQRLDRIIASVTPAHIPHRVEVVPP